MLNNNWYVITGAFCSGKTTTVAALEKMGYKVVHETARVYIDQKLKEGLTIQEIRKDEKAFQDKIIEMKIEIEKSLDKQDLLFLDRAVPDTYAYYKLHGIPINIALKNLLKKCIYKKVFLLDQLPYEFDYARTETKKQQDKLHELLKGAYQQLNFEIVKVPVLPIEERVKLILKNL